MSASLVNRLLVTVLFIKFVSSFEIVITPPPRKMLNFTELVSAVGHRTETHQTITEDGYILTLFNIPGNKSCPVLVMHGVLASADSFILPGKKSLAVALANQGYDVWIGNYRGNRYNRRHVRLNADKDAEFWNFTFHEIGYYDLPANIDYILNKTHQTQLSAVGFSLGNTLLYVLGSTRPEYNDKIKIFIALAPIAYFRHVEPPVSTLIEMESFISRILHDKAELVAKKSREKALISMCRTPIGYLICKRIFSAFSGAEEDDIGIHFYLREDERFPDSVSKKLAQHLAQLRKTFSLYDYGTARNLQVYNSTIPPAYNLSNCTMKTALYVGGKDRLSVVKDVEFLRDQLPNVVEWRVIGHDSFNHIDFIWGKNITEDLYPYIFDLLQKYS